jgi:hypothetical protein
LTHSTAVNDPSVLTGALATDVSGTFARKRANDHKRIRVYFPPRYISRNPGIVVAKIFHQRRRPVTRRSGLLLIARKSQTLREGRAESHGSDLTPALGCIESLTAELPKAMHGVVKFGSLEFDYEIEFGRKKRLF